MRLIPTKHKNRLRVSNVKEQLLKVEDLKTYFYTDAGIVRAVDGVSFDIPRETTVGLVGESGCGKSVTARSILQIVPPPGKIVEGKIIYNGDGDHSIDLVQLDPKGEEIRHIRGKKIAMIFQDPMTCLSPVHTIGNQVMESILLHESNIGKAEARDKAINLLTEVGIPTPERQIDTYPFELSGGMRQRALIAVALAADPELLIADEPTTAIDVTIQAKFLDLLRKLQEERLMSILFITHDLGVIAEISKKVVVMYLGKVVEKGRVEGIYDQPKHPYTQALFKCIPHLEVPPKKILATVKGTVPDPFSRPSGCPFGDRCPSFMKGICDLSVPSLTQVEEDHYVSCFLYANYKERKDKG